MHFIIVGAGALGSILAVHLKQAGHEVVVIARGRRAEYLQQHGVGLRGLLETQVECPVVTDPATLDETDVLVITPKTYHHTTALEQVNHIRATSVFSVANGIQKTEQLVSTFGIERTLGCMADLSGELLDDGEVLFTRNVDLQIGALDPGYQSQAQAVATAVHDAGINCTAVNNITGVEWSKFLAWAGFLALSVTTRLESHRFLTDPAAASVLYHIVQEMYELAVRLEINLDDPKPSVAVELARATPDHAAYMIREMGNVMRESAPAHKMSALQDLENGRPIEVEETLGDALEKARAVGVEIPTVETCYRLLAAINRNLLSQVE